MSENGTWVSDPSTYATCLNGKLDVLKYCRKVCLCTVYSYHEIFFFGNSKKFVQFLLFVYMEANKQLCYSLTAAQHKSQSFM